MARDLNDILTAVAYRLGESATPSDASENSRRIRYVNEGYRKVVSRMPFWFTEASTTFNSVADQETYTTSDGFPSDFRDAIELRVDDIVYTAIPKLKIFGLYDRTQNLFNYDNLVTNKHYYIYDNTLHILPNPSSNGTDNISLKYYKYPALVSDTTDTFVIPDFYLDALVAYTYARISHKDGLRGDAQDGFTEFEEILQEMLAENNRQRFYSKSIRPVHPSYLVD